MKFSGQGLEHNNKKLKQEMFANMNFHAKHRSNQAMKREIVRMKLMVDSYKERKQADLAKADLQKLTRSAKRVNNSSNLKQEQPTMPAAPVEPSRTPRESTPSPVRAVTATPSLTRPSPPTPVKVGRKPQKMAKVAQFIKPAPATTIKPKRVKNGGGGRRRNKL